MSFFFTLIAWSASPQRHVYYIVYGMNIIIIILYINISIIVIILCIGMSIGVRFFLRCRRSSHIRMILHYRMWFFNRALCVRFVRMLVQYVRFVRMPRPARMLVLACICCASSLRLWLCNQWICLGFLVGGSIEAFLWCLLRCMRVCRSVLDDPWCTLLLASMCSPYWNVYFAQIVFLACMCFVLQLVSCNCSWLLLFLFMFSPWLLFVVAFPQYASLHDFMVTWEHMCYSSSTCMKTVIEHACFTGIVHACDITIIHACIILYYTCMYYDVFDLWYIHLASIWTSFKDYLKICLGSFGDNLVVIYRQCLKCFVRSSTHFCAIHWGGLAPPPNRSD